MHEQIPTKENPFNEAKKATAHLKELLNTLANMHTKGDVTNVHLNAFIAGSNHWLEALRGSLDKMEKE